MENQITEFIGLACFKAHQDYDAEAVPQGVVDKMLVLAKRLGLPLENLETQIFKRGEFAAWRRPTLVVNPQNVDLKRLTSKYFNSESSAGGTLFRHTEYFAREFAQLSRKPYFVQYEAFVTDSLRIRKLPGGLDNLLFLTLAGESALRALAADLELMFDPVSEFVRTEIYLGHRGRPKDPSRVLQEVKDAKSALDTKVKILKSRDKYLERIQDLPKSVFMNRILEQARYFPEDCLLWDLAEWLASLILEVAVTIMDTPGPLPLMRAQLIASLQEIVQQISQITYQEPIVASGSPDEQFLALIDAFQHRLHAWIRAILGQYDSDYFDAHRLDQITEITRNIIVCYDIKRSTKTLDDLLRIGTAEVRRDIDRWRSKLSAVPSNWSILFDGVLKNTEGDQVIAFFDRPNKGLDSNAITLIHVDLLESVNLNRHIFRLGLKSGIGSGAVFLAAGQEMAKPINYIYHAIDDVCKVSPSDDWKSTALILDDFLQDHWDLERLCSQKFDFEDGTAHLFDHQSWAKELIARTKS